MRLAGFVLAGGESRRMGEDKALLEWDGTTVLQRICCEVAKVAESVVVLGASNRYAGLGFHCWDDVHPGLGPIGALETMLTRTSEEWNLVVAVDLPGVDQRLLSGLKETAGIGHGLATVVSEVPEDSPEPGEAVGRIHPLCGIYGRPALAAVREAINGNDLRVLNLIKRLKAVYHVIPYRLINVNRPEDWSAFLASASRSS